MRFELVLGTVRARNSVRVRVRVRVRIAAMVTVMGKGWG